MPQKLNKAGKMQDYIPAGNGDPSGEYGTSKGTNKNFTASDKKSSKANVITENKSVVVGNKKNKTIKVRNEDVDIVDEMPNGFAVDEVLNKTSPYTPDGYLWISDAETSGLIDRQYKLIEKDKWYNRGKDNKANIINDDLTGVKKNDNLTPTNALKIENMNEAQLDNEIEKTQREIDRLEKIMSNNKMSDNLSKDFPLGVGGSGWSAERKKQFSQSVERDTIKAKNYTDAYNEKESLNNRLNALNKAKDQIKGTGKTQEQLKQDAINNTQSTLNWEKGKIPSPYGKGTINVIKANGYEIRSVDNGFYSIYKDGKSIGNTNKLKDAKAYVERKSKANIIS